MERILQSSRTRLARDGTRLVQGLREKSSWFVKNIVEARPQVNACAGPRILRRHPRTTRSNEPGQVQVMVETQEVQSGSPVQAAPPLPSTVPSGKTLKSVRRLRRVGGRAVVALKAVDEGRESDPEDFGCLYSIVGQDSCGPSEYHTALSHFTDLSGLGSMTLSPLFDESSGVAFARVCLGSDERILAASGSVAAPRRTPLVFTPTANNLTSPNFLMAPPSLVLTMPTPQIPYSPIFVPHSPITLSKYVEATTHSSVYNSFGPSPAPSASLSPAPSLPACDRCCLAQLEDGLVCRVCEKQWLACKLWYQAHDGGRRRWLTEPYIKPAESTARVRAVMGALSVPGSTRNSHLNHGLGLGPSVSFKQELPFRVLSTSSRPSSLHAVSGTGTGTGTWATRYWKTNTERVSLILVGFAKVERSVRDAGRTLWRTSAALLFPLSRKDRSPVSSRSKSDDSLATSWEAHIGGHRRQSSGQSSLCFGSLPGACITSSSRFVEHLV
ncbi:hypothetical protein C8Q78DRAFT_1019192 [Trametes maxima]|nr:hypothetical protein C8Q78DRAFT_1019192 [Trametes maxima]